MRVYLGSDHRGFYLVKKIAEYLKESGHQVEVIGSGVFDPEDDYPVVAQDTISSMQSFDADTDRAILICGSGQGIAMAANRYKSIRAGLGWSVESAKMIRVDEDSNVLTLSADQLEGNWELCKEILEIWLNTKYKSVPRFNRRVRQLESI